jgi:hypothetical protein
MTERIAGDYVCPECEGKTRVRWKDSNTKGQQIIVVEHLPQCQTGIDAYNLVYGAKQNGQ